MVFGIPESLLSSNGIPKSGIAAVSAVEGAALVPPEPETQQSKAQRWIRAQYRSAHLPNRPSNPATGARAVQTGKVDPLFTGNPFGERAGFDAVAPEIRFALTSLRVVPAKAGTFGRDFRSVGLA